MEKFRVWCKDRGEWESYNTYLKSDGQLIHLDKGRLMPLGKDNHIVEFYTGVKDNKRTKEYPDGQEIYNGYIVHCISHRDSANMIVIFEKGEFRMVLCEKYKTYTEGSGYYAIRCFEKEIIGNIHENPELIGGEE